MPKSLRENRRWRRLWELIPLHFLTFVLGGWNWSHHFHNTLHGQSPVGFLTLQPWGCNQKILSVSTETRSERSALPCRHTHLCSTTTAESAVMMTSDRQTDCRCARVRSINVMVWIMLSFGLTELSVFGKSQATTFIIVSVSWMCLARPACCCQRPTVWFISYKEHALVLTHTSCLRANPQNKACVLQLQADWSDKPKLSAPWPTSWFTAMYGFYSTHSPLITRKMYQNYSPQTACSQPEVCLDVTGRRCEYSLMAIICSLHFQMEEDVNHLVVFISYIHPNSALKSKRSVMEPQCLSDMIIFTHCFLTFPSSVAVFVAGTGSKLWEVPTASFTSSSNLSESLQWEQDCQYRHLQDRVRITADIPPRLDGTWVSTRWIVAMTCQSKSYRDFREYNMSRKLNKTLHLVVFFDLSSFQMVLSFVD